MDNEPVESEPSDIIEPTSLEQPVSSEISNQVSKKSKKMSMKTIIIVVVIIVLAVAAYFSRSLFIAATVDGTSISRLTVIKELEKVSGKNLLDSLITEKLIENEAMKNNITVSDDDINAEIKKIEDQITAQGATLEEALTSQNMTLADLKKQIAVQKKIEKIVADQLEVTDEEVNKYISDNSITIPEGQEFLANTQIKEQLRSQKLNTAATALIFDLKSKANIKYYVNY